MASPALSGAPRDVQRRCRTRVYPAATGSKRTKTAAGCYDSGGGGGGGGGGAGPIGR